MRAGPRWAQERKYVVVVLAVALASAVVIAVVAQSDGDGNNDPAEAGAIDPDSTESSAPEPNPSTGDEATCALHHPSDPAQPSTASFSDTLRSADAGDVICVHQGRYDDPLIIDRSGTEAARLTVRGLPGASVHSVEVHADHVTVEGFDISGALAAGTAGVLVDGDRVMVRDNRIHDMVGIGVGCAQTFVGQAPRCVGATIAGNEISDIDGWGIWIWGEGNVVAANDISRLFASVSEDADAIRFFGAGHEIRSNYIHDIDESRAAPDRDPHSDCFQTYDLEGEYAALEDILIDGNVCSTDRHGIIMTQLTGEMARNIRIQNNVFISNGAAAALILGDGVGPAVQYQDVIVTNNIITGDIDFHGIQASNGLDLQVANNIFFGDFEPFWGPSLDPSNGATTTNNLTATAADFNDLDDADPRRRYRPATGSAAIDAGLNELAPAVDIDGRARPADGNGDGVATVDIGPYEYIPASP